MNPLNKTNRKKFLGWTILTSLAGFFGMIYYPIINFIMHQPLAESPVNSCKTATAEELKLNSGKIFLFTKNHSFLSALSKAGVARSRTFSAHSPVL